MKWKITQSFPITIMRERETEREREKERGREGGRENMGERNFFAKTDHSNYMSTLHQ